MAKGIRLALAAAIGLLAAVSAASAQTPTIKRDSIKPIADISGDGSYKAYCAVCHGNAGKGDGPAAKALKVPPSDLTQITKRHGGKYPEGSIKMHITGDTVVASHGSREMPVWGPLFRSVDGSVDVLRVRNLVVYLEQMQEK